MGGWKGSISVEFRQKFLGYFQFRHFCTNSLFFGRNIPFWHKFALSAPSSTYLEPRKSPFQKSLLEWSEQGLLGSSDSVFKVSKGQIRMKLVAASLKKLDQGQVFITFFLIVGVNKIKSILSEDNRLVWRQCNWSTIPFLCWSLSITLQLSSTINLLQTQLR